MGMFDDVLCDVPLPVLVREEYGRRAFQTKDLEEEMSTVRIRKDGTLWQETPPWGHGLKGFVDDPSSPLGIRAEYGDRSWDPRQILHDGDLEFYGFEDGAPSSAPQGWWLEYLATFKAGRLIALSLVRRDRSPIESPVDVPVPAEDDDADDDCDRDIDEDDERLENHGTSLCDGSCVPMCDWCLVSHACPEDCGGGDGCPYAAMGGGAP